jgi:hypothetical protein
MRKQNRNSRVRIRFISIIACSLIIITLITLPYNHGFASGQNGHSFISEPGNIPFLSNWETPVIEPGNAGKLKFTLTNRYLERGLPSNDMIDVVLFLGIYQYATLDETATVNKDFDDPPSISKLLSFKSSRRDTGEEVTGIITNEPETDIELFRLSWSTIPVNITYTIEVEIKTGSSTPEGTYFIKTELRFDHASIDNKSFVMKSKGHYTKSVWDRAKDTAPEDFSPGLNLSTLEVDGVLPDSAFTVKIPPPSWPRYAIVGFMVMFGVLAVVFYYMEEHGKFPKLKEKLDGKGKSK